MLMANVVIKYAIHEVCDRGWIAVQEMERKALRSYLHVGSTCSIVVLL